MGAWDFWLSLQENLHAHKIPRLGGGLFCCCFFWGGGGKECNFIFMGAGIFLKIERGKTRKWLTRNWLDRHHAILILAKMHTPQIRHKRGVVWHKNFLEDKGQRDGKYGMQTRNMACVITSPRFDAIYSACRGVGIVTKLLRVITRERAPAQRALSHPIPEPPVGCRG